MWPWTISSLGILLQEQLKARLLGRFVGTPISGRWASHAERGVCLAVFAYSRLCRGRNCSCVGTGCGFCLLTAASIRPRVDMAKGLTPVPESGGAEKGRGGNHGSLERSLSCTLHKPGHTRCCLVQLRGSCWGQLPAKDLCCTEASTQPSSWNWWAQRAGLGKNLQLRHLATVFQHPSFHTSAFTV